METLAYLHLCTVYEEANHPDAEELQFFEGCSWQPPSSAWLGLISTIVALSILSLASSVSAYIARVRTNGSPLNVRTGPGLSYAVVDALPNGSQVRLDGNRSGSWSQLFGRNWVSSDWIDSIISRSSRTYQSRSYRYRPAKYAGRKGTTPSSTKMPSTPSDRVVLQFGSKGIAVATLQDRLRDLNYFNGQITAIYDDRTATAIANFQYKNGLQPVDGIARQQTLKKVQTAWNAQYPTSGQRGNLKYGSRGSTVARLQDRLQDLGFLRGKTTGYYDRTTQNAVTNFQYQYELPANGAADRRTQQEVANTYNNFIKDIANNGGYYGNASSNYPSNPYYRVY